MPSLRDFPLPIERGGGIAAIAAPGKTFHSYTKFHICRSASTMDPLKFIHLLVPAIGAPGQPEPASTRPAGKTDESPGYLHWRFCDSTRSHE